MQRRLCNHPVQVQLGDHGPVHFFQDGRRYEVIALLKTLSLVRPQNDIDLQLWQVRARRVGSIARTYELRCDHGDWHMIAVWA